MSDQRSKIGLFGGSFDPVHLAHLNIAKELYKAYKVDLIYFIPANQSPLKGRMPIASNQHRLNMLKLALQDYPPFDILDWELHQDGPSYTINTVEYIKSKAPQADLYWLIGEDQVSLLHKWVKIEELVRYVTFIAIKRPPHIASQDPEIKGLKLEWLLTHTSATSSTEIRNQIKSGKSVDFFLPSGVSKYIHSHKVYQ